MTTLEVSAALATIEGNLRRFDRHLLEAALQPGIPEANLEEALGRVRLPTSSGLRSLYRWRNGTSTEGVAAIDGICLFPGFYFLSVEDAVASYQAFVDDSRWRTGWFPIFANGGGDFYLVDTRQPAADAIRHFRIEESEHPIEFSSLETMLQTLAEAFVRGAFFVDPNGYLEMDDVVFGRLAAELNPDVGWWRDETQRR